MMQLNPARRCAEFFHQLAIFQKFIHQHLQLGIFYPAHNLFYLLEHLAYIFVVRARKSSMRTLLGSMTLILFTTIWRIFW